MKLKRERAIEQRQYQKIVYIQENKILNKLSKMAILNNAKTVLCSSFMETGKCKYGKNCTFAHGEDELKSLKFYAKPCILFNRNGRCDKGNQCEYLHFKEPYVIKPCLHHHVNNVGQCKYGDTCQYSHLELTENEWQHHFRKYKYPGVGYLRYTKKPCFHFHVNTKGQCKYGNKCLYDHSSLTEDEWIFYFPKYIYPGKGYLYQRRPCLNYHMKGYCRYDNSCHFDHSKLTQEELDIYFPKYISQSSHSETNISDEDESDKDIFSDDEDNVQVIIDQEFISRCLDIVNAFKELPHSDSEILENVPDLFTILAYKELPQDVSVFN